MICISQHGPAGTLFDLNAFLDDVAAFVDVDQWQVSVEQCLGENALRIEAQTFPEPALFDPAELRALYRGIYQTIDGLFTGLRDGRPQCELVAVDSSFWEVSGPPQFEAHMQHKYGLHGHGGAAPEGRRDKE